MSVDWFPRVVLPSTWRFPVTVKLSSNVCVPDTVKVPPIWTSFSIPTPPATLNAPDVVVVAFVVAAIATKEVFGVLWKLTLVAEDVAPRFNVVAFGTLKVALRMVAIPVVAPISSAVAAPAKFRLVATVL